MLATEHRQHMVEVEHAQSDELHGAVPPPTGVPTPPNSGPIPAVRGTTWWIICWSSSDRMI